MFELNKFAHSSIKTKFRQKIWPPNLSSLNNYYLTSINLHITNYTSSFFPLLYTYINIHIRYVVILVKIIYINII